MAKYDFMIKVALSRDLTMDAHQAGIMVSSLFISFPVDLALIIHFLAVVVISSLFLQEEM